MKAIIVPLFTATLSVVVCSAFPLDEKTTKGQQTNNLCATLEYPQPEPTGYVRLCYTAGVGNTYILVIVILFVCTYVFNTISVVAGSFHKPDETGKQPLLIAPFFSILHYYCRYLHHGNPSYVSILHHAECS